MLLIGKEKDLMAPLLNRRFVALDKHLRAFLNNLDDPTHIYADITAPRGYGLPKDEGLMKSLLVINIPQQYINFSSYFRWGEQRKYAQGVVGTCVTTKSPIVIRDLFDETDINANMFIPTTPLASGSIVSVPIIKDRKCLAALSITSIHRGFFTDKEAQLTIEFTESIKDEVSSLIKYVWLTEDRQKHSQEEGFDKKVYNIPPMAGEKLQPSSENLSTHPPETDNRLTPENIVDRLPLEEKLALLSALIKDVASDEGGYEVVVEMLRSLDHVRSDEPLPAQTEEMVDPNAVSEAFAQLLEKQRENARREPVRYERIRQAFQGRESDSLTIEDFIPLFRTKKSVYNTIALVSDDLREYGFEIEQTRRFGQTTTYRIRPYRHSP